MVHNGIIELKGLERRTVYVTVCTEGVYAVCAPVSMDVWGMSYCVRHLCNRGQGMLSMQQHVGHAMTLSLGHDAVIISTFSQKTLKKTMLLQC